MEDERAGQDRQREHRPKVRGRLPDTDRFGPGGHFRRHQGIDVDFDFRSHEIRSSCKLCAEKVELWSSRPKPPC